MYAHYGDPICHSHNFIGCVRDMATVETYAPVTLLWTFEPLEIECIINYIHLQVHEDVHAMYLRPPTMVLHFESM